LGFLTPHFYLVSGIAWLLLWSLSTRPGYMNQGDQNKPRWTYGSLTCITISDIHGNQWLTPTQLPLGFFHTTYYTYSFTHNHFILLRNTGFLRNSCVKVCVSCVNR